jgi:hypothetical protein
LDKESAKEYIQKSIDDFEKFLSVVTGTPCRVCIKIISDIKTLQVKTFSRSSFSVNVKCNSDIGEDFVYNNSDFKALFEKKERYWYVNNVDTATNYINSHVDSTSNEKKSKQLGYKTSFTWPIRKISYYNDDNGELNIYGFLCADSKVSNVFMEKYDFDSGALIADFYYFLLKKYFDISEKKELKNAM